MDKLETKLNLLITQPHMGRARPELMRKLQSFPYARYIVFFLAEPEGIEIVRVVHSARDITAEDFDSSRRA